MTKEEKAIEFVENFVKYGFRIDTQPTRKWSIIAGHQLGQMDEWQWWSDYVGGAEERMREAARKALED